MKGTRYAETEINYVIYKHINDDVTIWLTFNMAAARNKLKTYRRNVGL